MPRVVLPKKPPDARQATPQAPRPPGDAPKLASLRANGVAARLWRDSNNPVVLVVVLAGMVAVAWYFWPEPASGDPVELPCVAGVPTWDERYLHCDYAPPVAWCVDGTTARVESRRCPAITVRRP